MTASKIQIELFPAGNGDTILVNIDNKWILIDGGYTSTYRDHLKPRLKEINQNGGTLSYFIITHIDADHITGAIAFLKENGNSLTPNIINIEDIWHNSYRHLQFEFKKQGILQEAPQINIDGGIASTETETEESNVSFGQGSTLGSQIIKNEYSWNSWFDSKAVMSEKPLKQKLFDDVCITLLGPSKETLQTLGDKWYKDLKYRYEGEINEDVFFDDAFELLVEEIRQAEEAEEVNYDPESQVSGSFDWVKAEYGDFEEDRSPSNGSSISFILETGNKKLLFLGDSIPSEIVKSLKQIYDENEFPVYFDVIKVAHHGAYSNNSPEMHKLIQGGTYLFSSNGKRHHHPHFETMAMILNNHKDKENKRFVFNYKQGDRLLDVDNQSLKNKYKYLVQWPEEDKDGYIKFNL